MGWQTRGGKVVGQAKTHNLKLSSREEHTSIEQTRQAETAKYIADMILELRNLAMKQDYDVLRGLLELAYYEAYGVANKVQIPVGETEHLEILGADARRAEGNF